MEMDGKSPEKNPLCMKLTSTDTICEVLAPILREVLETHNFGPSRLRRSIPWDQRLLRAVDEWRSLRALSRELFILISLGSLTKVV